MGMLNLGISGVGVCVCEGEVGGAGEQGGVYLLKISVRTLFITTLRSENKLLGTETFYIRINHFYNV